jgi:hypothetical protein
MLEGKTGWKMSPPIFLNHTLPKRKRKKKKSNNNLADKPKMELPLLL